MPGGSAPFRSVSYSGHDAVTDRFYTGCMSTIELPDDVAAALAAAAAQRGVTEAELIAELVGDAVTDELDAFIGVGASGRTGPIDIHVERADLAAEHDAATI